MTDMGSISSISNTLFSSLSLSNSASSATTSTSDVSGTDNTDKQHLSPLAKLLSQLQDLQQSDPSKYKDVTAQIATKLQAAAQTAEAGGDTAGAKRLDQLASDFSSASSSGQLPKIDNLAQSVHHGHGHHGHHAPPPSDSTTTDGTSTDPLQIILDTLNSSGTATS